MQFVVDNTILTPLPAVGEVTFPVLLWDIWLKSLKGYPHKGSCLVLRGMKNGAYGAVKCVCVSTVQNLGSTQCLPVTAELQEHERGSMDADAEVIEETVLWSTVALCCAKKNCQGREK